MRCFLSGLFCLVLAGAGIVRLRSGDHPAFLFKDAASEWGLNRPVIYGDPERQDYILESTGSGVAAFDYDNDGLPDLFVVNGSRLKPFANGKPISMLYRNAGDHFVDVTEKSGLGRHGWNHSLRS